MSAVPVPSPTVPAPTPQAPTPRQRHYLNVSYSAKSWLLTVDHKRIGILYMLSVTFFFVLGGIAAALVRMHLVSPQGALLSAEGYNRAFSAHGIIMVFLFLIPVIPATLGNFFVPLMIGARDLAFPKLNLASWYVYMVGGLFTLWALISGGIDTGWTFYVPYSTNYATAEVIPVLVGISIAGFSSLFTAINFIVTVHKMRAPGLTWFRLPLFIWSMYAMSIIIILSTPVITIGLMILIVERILRIGIFDPALGGDPVLFQHIFWFYSHPAVYIMILPAFACISEIIATFSRKHLFGYKFVAFASLGIAFIGFLVWGHHMFVSGQSVYAGLVFSLLSFIVAIPSAIKVFNWTATLYKGSISFDTPMLYALGFIGLFVPGGLTGLYLSTLATDVHLHDTYFVVAHFHYVMVGGTVTAYLGGIHYWWPKMTGRMYPEGWGKLAALILFIGFNLTFAPQFIYGHLGMPRRYYSYPPEYQVLNVLSSAGASMLAVGYALPLFYLFWSLRWGPLADANPWRATGLEWQTTSPPPPHNFERTPIVTEEPYAYHPDRPEDDFTPQGYQPNVVPANVGGHRG